MDKISREWVANVWRGEWKYSYTTKVDHFAVVKCSRCNYEAFAMSLTVSEGNFCPYCGAAMTDEAMDIVMLRLEALQDAYAGNADKRHKSPCKDCKWHDVFWKGAGCNLLNNMEPCRFEAKDTNVTTKFGLEEEDDGAHIEP